MGDSGQDGLGVSIVIPSYKPQFFRECLESALAQDYTAIKIFVSDDCPTGGVAEICRDFPTVKYSRNPSPGQYANFDRCMSLANGALTKFLFDDDVLQPSCIRRMVDAFVENIKQHPCLVASTYEKIDERGRVLGSYGFRVGHSRELMVNQTGLRSIMYHATNFIGPLTCVMIPDYSRNFLGADYFSRRMKTEVRGLSDVALYFDLRNLGPIVYMSELLAQFRMSTSHLTAVEANPDAILTLTAWEALAEEALECGLLAPERYAHALARIAERYERWEEIFPELGPRRLTVQDRIRSVGRSDCASST